MTGEVQKATSSCCGKAAGGECVCAKQATCSCGQKPALQCSCDKSASENATSGSRCQCGARPAGACTCEQSGTTSTGGSNANEIDFTTKK